VRQIRIWLAVFLMLTIGATHAQAAARVQEITTPKGIKAWLVEEHSLPLISAQIVFRDSGSAYDPEPRQGRANMAAAMLMEGAGDMNSRAFNDALERYAIRMNSSVGEDHFFASISSLSEHSDKAFTYLGLALTQPLLAEDSLERVRRQSLSVIDQQQQNPHFLAAQSWKKRAYGTHPYSRMGLGTADGLAALGADDLRDYFQRYLTRENMVISVVGDITPEALSAFLDTHLSSLPASYQPDSIVADIQISAALDDEMIDFDVPQTVILFGTEGLKREDPDYIPAYVMNEILGGNGLTSRLAGEIREKRGLTYGIGTALVPSTHGGRWQGQFSTRNDMARDALALLKQQLAFFAKDGPSDEELARSKAFLIGSFALRLDNTADLANFITIMQLQNLGSDYMEKRNALIASVTKEQVAAAAKRLLQDRPLLVTMIGKPTAK
jgi:zinc protease